MSLLCLRKPFTIKSARPDQSIQIKMSERPGQSITGKSYNQVKKVQGPLG